MVMTMRAAVLSFVAVFGFFSLVAAAQAAPATPRDLPAGGAAITLVRGGCGPGWHPVWWRGPYGHMHRRCVPNYRRW